MQGPMRQGRHWWQVDSSEKWYRWENDSWVRQDDLKFPPPPRWSFPAGTSIEPGPFAVYALGVIAALIALVITTSWVADSSVGGVLAPVMGVVGAFTGHAAGHSAALRAMRTKRD
jgi:hypothetical protein